MFGRHPRLVLDVVFGVKCADMGSVNTDEYVDKLRSHHKWAYKVTQGTHLKKLRDTKNMTDIGCSKLEAGDLVLVRQKAFGGKHKV